MPWKHASGLVYSEAEYLKLEEMLNRAIFCLGNSVDIFRVNPGDYTSTLDKDILEWWEEYKKRDASLHDIKGKAPDITGDLSSEDFVAKGREGWGRD